MQLEEHLTTREPNLGEPKKESRPENLPIRERIKLGIVNEPGDNKYDQNPYDSTDGEDDDEKYEA